MSDIDLSKKSAKGWAQKTYRVSFANGLSITAHALDKEDAVDLAIDHMERISVIHDSITSIEVLA